MNSLEKKFEELAELAISNGECGAQLEVKDEVLREALLESVKRELRKAYEMNS